MLTAIVFQTLYRISAVCYNFQRQLFIYRLKSVEYAKRTKHKTTRYAGEEIEVVQKNTNPI